MAVNDPGGLYREVAVRAVEEALYHRLIDKCWDEIREVFERPEVKAAEEVILRALAEAFAPERSGKGSPPRISF